MKIELGNKVKDLITDFEGIVTQRGTFITGCDRIEVKNKEGRVEWFDIPTIELIDEGVSKQLMENGCNAFDNLDEALYNFGIKAIDKVTEYEGVIIGKCIALTGDITYALSPKHNQSARDNSATWFDESRIEVIKEEKINVKNSSKRTGGAVPSLNVR